MTDNEPDFERLAILMLNRRDDLAKLAGRPQGPTSVEDHRTLAAKFRISHATMAQRVDIDHHWAAGSVDTVLAGGDPTPLDGLPEAWKPKPRRKGIPPEIRTLPTVTEQAIDDAVLAARAVVELADLRDRLEAECEHLDATVLDLRAQVKAASERAEQIRQRAYRVEELHSEAEELACGDGCCHTGLGHCRECGESYPCTTAWVARGKTIEEARALVRAQPVPAKTT